MSWEFCNLWPALWSTSKSGPVFSKLFRLDRTDPLSSGPKFPDILVEWIAPSVHTWPFNIFALFTRNIWKARPRNLCTVKVIPCERNSYTHEFSTGRYLVVSLSSKKESVWQLGLNSIFFENRWLLVEVWQLIYSEWILWSAVVTNFARFNWEKNAFYIARE